MTVCAFETSETNNLTQKLDRKIDEAQLRKPSEEQERRELYLSELVKMNSTERLKLVVLGFFFVGGLS